MIHDQVLNYMMTVRYIHDSYLARIYAYITMHKVIELEADHAGIAFRWWIGWLATHHE